ncbi:MAG: thioredoxin domain-containing protein [Bacteroidales bacterium]|jgi:thioredoxin|nr:thioredoxin domain-containing protein [Bacteroidales bacterium]
MKHIFLTTVATAFFLVSCNSNDTANAQESTESQQETSQNQESATEEKKAVSETTAPAQTTGKVVKLTTAEFKELVYDYTQHPDKWVYKGTKPCVIDFYADWCRPCKIIAPIMEELAAEYGDQITIYKIDTEAERELAQVFQIRSIPMVVFCPVNGNPQGTMGALSKEQYKTQIDAILTE